MSRLSRVMELLKESEQPFYEAVKLIEAWSAADEHLQNARRTLEASLESAENMLRLGGKPDAGKVLGVLIYTCQHALDELKRGGV